MSESQQHDPSSHTTPKDVFERMIDAANRHDLETMVACFAPDYRSELPFTPERNFIGQDGVRKNWSFFFATMPDFQIEVLNVVFADNVVWAELFFHGTQTDGKEQMMRGVHIAGIQGEQFAWAKLYQSEVQEPPAYRA